MLNKNCRLHELVMCIFLFIDWNKRTITLGGVARLRVCVRVFALYQYLIYTLYMEECVRVFESECESESVSFERPFRWGNSTVWDEIKLSKKIKTTWNYNILDEETKNSQSNSLKHKKCNNPYGKNKLCRGKIKSKRKREK